MISKLNFLNFILIGLLCLSACSTMHYTAEDIPMINFRPCKNASDDFFYEERQSFFFWGLIPNTLEINVTKMATENGAQSGLCSVQIEEIDTPVDVVMQIFTLGIYAPRTVKLSGKIINEQGVLD